MAWPLARRWLANGVSVAGRRPGRRSPPGRHRSDHWVRRVRCGGPVSPAAGPGRGEWVVIWPAPMLLRPPAARNHSRTTPRPASPNASRPATRP